MKKLKREAGSQRHGWKLLPCCRRKADRSQMFGNEIQGARDGGFQDKLSRRQTENFFAAIGCAESGFMIYPFCVPSSQQGHPNQHG